MQNWGTWGASWAWSLALVAITLAIHIIAIVLIASAIERSGARPLHPGSKYLDSVSGTIVIIVAVALLLAVLHAIESLLWAVAYVELGALPSAADAALYSVDSITTRGSSGLELAGQWRMMGATEAGDGMLLFGTSMAFLFYVMLRLWRSRWQSGE